MLKEAMEWREIQEIRGEHYWELGKVIGKFF